MILDSHTCISIYIYIIYTYTCPTQTFTYTEKRVCIYIYIYICHTFLSIFTTYMCVIKYVNMCICIYMPHLYSPIMCIYIYPILHRVIFMLYDTYDRASMSCAPCEVVYFNSTWKMPSWVLEIFKKVGKKPWENMEHGEFMDDLPWFTYN